MLLHELGQCFAAHRQFAPQSQELTLLVPNNSGGGAPGFKSGASFLEKCLLPLVKERRLNVVLVAHIAHRHTLGRGRVAALVSHGVAVGWRWRAPLGRGRVAALASHGVAVGW